MRQIRSFFVLALFAWVAAPLFAAAPKADGSASAQAVPGCPTASGICVQSMTPAAPAAAWDGPGCPTASGICALPAANPVPFSAWDGPGCPTASGLCALPAARNRAGEGLSRMG